MNTHVFTMAVADTTATTRWQHSVAIMAITPPAAGLEGALEVARALLHNPPDLDASPTAVEQWRNDVDQLIIVAINMPLHGGWQANHSCGSTEPSPALSCTPTVAHTPTAASFAMTDLRAELEHHRSREDGHTTIERRRKRRRNLDSEYSAAKAAPTGHAAQPPSSLGTWGGCATLASHLRMVVWPCKLRPHLPEKYDRTVNPVEFMQIYTTSILAAGGNEAVMANYFPVALTGTAQPWLMNLTQGPCTPGKSCVISSRPTLRVLTLGPAMRSTSTSCSSAQGTHCGPSSSGSPRFKTPSSHL
jgi:hypothetical protein